MPDLMRIDRRPIFWGFFGREKSVRATYTSAKIRSDLAHETIKMAPTFLSVFRIKGLETGQYESFKTFLSALNEKIQGSQKIDFPLLLRVPAAKEMRLVDFSRLVNNGTAMGTIFTTCFLQADPGEINLEPLYSIYRLNVS